MNKTLDYIDQLAALKGWMEIIAAAEIERAERADNTEKAAVWKRRFQAVSHSAATIFGLIALPYGIWLTDRLCILC